MISTFEVLWREKWYFFKWRVNNMLNVKNAMKSDRLMKAITGMTVGEFWAILPVFSKILHETAVWKERVRRHGGGAIHTLSNAEAKLFYTLLYLKCYPTFDLAAFFYNVDRAQTCRWRHSFMPILGKVLGKEVVLPARQIKSAEEFIRLFPEVNYHRRRRWLDLLHLEGAYYWFS